MSHSIITLYFRKGTILQQHTLMCVRTQTRHSYCRSIPFFHKHCTPILPEEKIEPGLVHFPLGHHCQGARPCFTQLPRLGLGHTCSAPTTWGRQVAAAVPQIFHRSFCSLLAPAEVRGVEASSGRPSSSCSQPQGQWYLSWVMKKIIEISTKILS